MNNKIIISSIEEIKQIQLDILASLHEFCVENSIKYSLAYGSLIGAIRHKGFIPWDDDIDVFLLRKEYDRLVSLFPKSYKGCYSLITRETDKKWHRAYGKLCDDRTVEIENTLNVYAGIGLGIDIFPVDDVPDEMDSWMNYERKRRFFRNVMMLKTLTLSKKRTFLKNCVVLLGRIVLLPFSIAFIAKVMDSYAQKNNGKGFNHVYENGYGSYNTKKPWHKSDFQDTIDAPFETITVMIMRGYDSFLTSVYGDYMRLPPKEQRISHHVFTAYWKEA